MKIIILFRYFVYIIFLIGNITLYSKESKAATNFNSLYFIENQGQWPNEVLYLYKANGINTWITKNGFVCDIYKDSNFTDEPIFNVRNGQVFKFDLINNCKESRWTGKKLHAAKFNYLISNDVKKWVTNVSSYGEVIIENIYNGIDMRYYFLGNELRYDFIVHKNAHANEIKFQFSGIDLKHVDTKELLFNGRFGEIKHSDLVVYQTNTNGLPKYFPASFKQNSDNSISIETKNYDKNKDLIIDPIIWSSFIGGLPNDDCYAMCKDIQGNLILAGASATGYPTTIGSYDTSWNGGFTDIVISKLNSTGTSLIYSTFIGGSNRDEAWGIVCDSNSNVYCTGRTLSNNFPTSTVTIDNSYNGGGVGDAFIIKLSTNGDSLVYSSFLGGSSTDWGYGIVLDNQNNAVIVGRTTSSNFPVYNSYDNTYNTFTDVFLTKINISTSSFVYSTFIGGSSDDIGTAICTDYYDNVYITGRTNSFTFPTTPFVFDNSTNLYYDVFVCKFNSIGGLLKSTFIGGNDYDEGYGIAVDSNSNVFVTGNTRSTNFPKTQFAFDTTFNSGTTDAFICGLDSSFNSLLFSTYLGGNLNETGRSVAVSDSIVYVTGETNSSNFPTVNAGSFSIFNTNADAFLCRFNYQGGVVNSALIGGNGNDYSRSLLVDEFQNVLLSGSTNSPNFPIVGPTISSFNSSNGEDYFILQFNFASTPLPINGLTITGNCLNEDIYIKCEGITYGTGEKVEIEYCFDAISFVSLMHLDSLEIEHLSKAIKLPLINDNVYIRIKHTDIDNKISYSNVLSIQCNEAIAPTIHPNPFNSEIFVQNLDGKRNIIKIYNEVGQELLMKETFNKNDKINTGNLSKGIYFVKVSNTYRTYTYKIYKE